MPPRRSITDRIAITVSLRFNRISRQRLKRNAIKVKGRMTQKTTGELLSEFRERSGLTLSEIARRAGYRGPSSVQMMFSPDYTVHPLNATIAERLAYALQGEGNPPIHSDEIFALARPRNWTTIQAANWVRGQQEDATLLFAGDDPESLPVSNEVEISGRPLPTLRGQPKDIPVFGTALAADLDFDENGDVAPVEQTLFEMGDIITFARRPPGIPADAKVYALYVSGSSMEPRYRPGDPLFVDPRKPPSIGDDVVVQLVSSNPDDPQIVAGLIKTLVKRTGSHLELEQYRPEIRFRVPMERVAHIHRVIPPNELFGI